MQLVYDYEISGEKGKVDAFVLMSESPRRRDLLAFLKPEIKSAVIDERAIEETYMEIFAEDDFLTRAAKVCCEISKAKCQGDLEDGKLYIAADTIVVSEGKILNKPQDLTEADAMLRSYFGKSHHVVTSVCLKTSTHTEVFYTLAQITFVPYYDALEEVIITYISDKKPLDKAGAYGIQELDPRFVQSIQGDIHTIIGLPVAEVSKRIFG